jgi:Zn-finger protein
MEESKKEAEKAPQEIVECPTCNAPREYLLREHGDDTIIRTSNGWECSECWLK